MSRKIYMLLSLVLIAAFALTACGAPATAAPAPTQEPAQPAQPAATEAPAQPAATEAPAEPVTINWWHISTAEEHKALFQKFADDYMAAQESSCRDSLRGEAWYRREMIRVYLRRMGLLALERARAAAAS